MKRILTLTTLILIIGCGGQAMIEIGINDEVTLGRGTLGDIAMRITRLELSEDATYQVLWEGVKEVQIPIYSTDFISITDDYIDVSPGSYQSIRVTIDSLWYVKETTSKMLLDSVCQFLAEAFTNIVIEENDEIRLVISINSAGWFDAESLTIAQGHNPFEGAHLKIDYQY